MNSHHHDDLAMMLRRCASALQAAGRADIAAAAMGLLERLGLGASPLRDVADAPAPAQQAEAPNGLPPLPAIDDYLPTDGPRWTTANFIACAQRYATDYARAALAATPAPAQGSWVSADDVDRLARDLDVAMNGEEGAAHRPALCDVVPEAVKRLAAAPAPAEVLSDAGSLFNAVARAMDMASRLAGAVARSDTEQADAYSASLRRKLWRIAELAATPAPAPQPVQDPPPLPDVELAEIRNDNLNRSALSETGVAYWGSNWREVRKLYTADQMHANYRKGYEAGLAATPAPATPAPAPLALNAVKFYSNRAATPAPAEQFRGARRRDAAEATLQRLGYEWHGGELWKPPLGKAPAWAATPAPAPQPLTDAQIDMATDHLYCDGRPVPAKYRIALGRIVERLAGQGKEASK